MAQVGSLFLALGGLCIAIFLVFAIVALLLRLWLNFEAFCAAKLREESGSDWSYGDVVTLPDDFKSPEVSKFHARSNDR